MITWRRLYWGGGFALLLLLSFWPPDSGPWWSAGLLLFAAIGLVIEALSGLFFSVSIRHLQPADGLVEIVPIPGALSTPNASDPRFGRLAGLEHAPAGSRTPGPGLLGRLQAVALFHSRGSRAWSDDEIALALDAAVRVGLWIEQQAQSYQAPVNVQIAASYVALLDPSLPEPRPIQFAPEPEQGGFSPFEEDEDVELIASVSRAVRNLDLPRIKDLPRLIEVIGRRLDTDGLAWLLFTRSAGRSFASLEHDLGLPGVNLAVIHAAEADLPGPLIGPPHIDPATIAHELLHLFGASDKYGRSLKSYARGSVTTRDVMRLSESRLSRLQVDPLTASELLWAASPVSPAPRA